MTQVTSQVIQILIQWILNNDQSKKYQDDATSEKQIILTNKAIINYAEPNQMPTDTHQYSTLLMATNTSEDHGKSALTVDPYCIINYYTNSTKYEIDH